MKRDTLMAVALLGLSAVLLSARVLLGIEIAPASASDILNALGPDASGLHISQDTLPDLFTLTASRIEENPKQFTIEQPYMSGRWKGGKAVIEYARDLSYTLVSIYDKSGHRQRIYSVASAFSRRAPSQAAAAPAAQTTESGWEREAPPPGQVAVGDQYGQSLHPKGVGTPAVASSAGNTSFEWDDSKGAYVQVASAVSAPASEVAATSAPAAAKSVAPTGSSPTARRRRHHRHGETTIASAQTFTPAPAKKTSLPAPVQDAGVWLPSAEKTKSARKAASREAVKAGNSTWVEHHEEAAPEETPVPKRKKKSKAAPAETVVAMATPSEQQKSSDVPFPIDQRRGQSPVGDEWVPKSIQASSAKSKDVEGYKRPVEGEVPSEEELLGNSAPAPSQTASTVSAAAEKPSRRHHAKTLTPEPPAAAPPTVTETLTASVPPRREAPKEETVPVPIKEELAAAGEKSPGPDTSESDKWVPKETPKPVVREPEVPAAEPMKVAMVPRSKPVDNSVDNLLKMANQGKEEMPRESENWVPKRSAAPSQETEINKEIARVQAEEKKQQAALPAPKVQIRHDVNNPEEGVLPVSSFEKFSGPMYGRHREYERRFYPGKKSRAKAPEHDFYVDEVDRKKEIHNIYYYLHQKGKAPRLVAVERHDKISFMGNYDIDKEDKGKITTYN